MPPSDYYTEVALGNVAGRSLVHKFGRNPDIDLASTFEMIWHGSVDYSGFDVAGAQTVDIVSDSTNDDVGGTGATSITIYGLDSSYDEVTEDISMDGTTPVTSVNSYLRLNRAVVVAAGDLGENDGEITISQTTSGTVFCYIPAEFNQAQFGGYTIPNNKTGYLLDLYGGISGSLKANLILRLRVRPNGETFQIKYESTIIGEGSSHLHHEFPAPQGPFTEKTDIKIEASSDTNNIVVSGGFTLLLVDD